MNNVQDAYTAEPLMFMHLDTHFDTTRYNMAVYYGV